ncbi:MAG: hypothetical protein HIU87_00515 [Acidobacteria bacterium]|nr:hypothetical protein [Acidobacteriota bacterium]
MKWKKSSGQKDTFHPPVLLVGEPSAALDRMEALLSGTGAAITRADNICYAELFSEQQYFDAAVYSDSLSAEEQISLARIMRVRWPWMKLVRCTSQDSFTPEPGLFDCEAESETAVPDCLRTAIFS